MLGGRGKLTLEIKVKFSNFMIEYSGDSDIYKY